MKINFKKYLLNEAFDTSNVEIGDILSSFQQLKADIDNIKRKDLINSLELTISSMRSLLNPKNDNKLISSLQKIICAIKDDIESNNDFNDTIDGSIYELENYLKNKKVTIDKPLEIPKDNSTSEPVKPKTPAETPKEVETNQEVAPPEQNTAFSPPLAGSGENQLNIA